MGSRTPPSEEARARLREEAAALDVEDIVDLCCSRDHDAVRVALYLDALRKKSGEKAQLGACLLCFDLARHGDASRDVEVQLLLPVVEELGRDDPRGLVRALTEKSDAVLALWTALLDTARTRDVRQAPAVPVDDDLAIDIDLFDDDDIVHLDAAFAGVLDAAFVDAEAQDAFDASFDRLWPVGSMLFNAESGDDLERLEKLLEASRSWSSSVPSAAELQAMTALFLATHMRALGLFGRRNKKRDALLREALATFASLPAPPAFAAAWFIEGGDVQGAAPHAWEKMAEALMDFAGFVGKAADEEEANVVVDIDAVVDAYVGDSRSANVKPVLAPPGQRRRR